MGRCIFSAYYQHFQRKLLPLWSKIFLCIVGTCTYTTTRRHIPEERVIDTAVRTTNTVSDLKTIPYCVIWYVCHPESTTMGVWKLHSSA